MKKCLIFLLAVILPGCQPHSPNAPVKPNAVKIAFNTWMDDVNHKNMQHLLSLYDEHADLHPTLSGKLRSSHSEIKDYFEHFLALPELHAEVSAARIQIFGDVAINDGFYTFSFTKNGKSQILKARYSFTYLKEVDGWKIIDHHSSVTPNDSPHNDLQK